MKINKDRIKFFGILIFLYSILFEFIVPVNRYFPKPIIIIDSFKDLFYDYNLAPSIILTSLIVLFVMLSSYLLIFLFRGIIISFLHNYKNLSKILLIFRNTPVIFVPIIFLFWFGANIMTEFIFVWFAAFVYLSVILNRSQKQISQAYIDSALSLGISQKKIYNEIFWKSIEPDLFDSFRNLNLLLWFCALLIEYIAGNFGIGSVYFQGFMYKDISAVFALTIFVSAIVGVIDWLLVIVKNYLIFWSSEI